ncbi:MAG TPA: molybdopterin-dependent oxidoreductase [Thermomicrobiales bacterium]|nr:molybdopterin-dependent oxidoreductase [Thermomicrobiales bacterium]
MPWIRRITTIVAGLLAGIVAACFLALLMVAARTWLGISPPPESVPDRIAPTLSINHFFSLFGKYGGYNGLKKYGVKTGIQALFGAGAVVGVLYAIVSETGFSRRIGAWRFGVSRIGAIFLAVLTLIVWLGSVIFLWPVLQTNFRGLPPSQARYVTIAGLFLEYLGFTVMLALTYWFVVRHARIAAERTDSGSDATAVTTGSPAVELGRPLARRSIVAAGAGAVFAYPAYRLIKRLYDRAVFPYDGTVYSGPGVMPITPNDKFYTVTKNVVDPNVNKAVWGLDIFGMVDRHHTYSYDDIVAMPQVKQETTLMCISNAIGAGLSSNAVWTGIPMAELLNKAGVQEGAVEVKLYGADGYTDTFAIEKALDPTTMVVYQMNGEPLAERHGYPVRLVVPGLFGEKNVKWVTGIEVIDHDGKGFYEEQGWGPDFEVPTRSDIFSPKRTRHSGQDSFDQTLPVNKPVTLKGRAFAGARGVKTVEVSLDNGETWQQAHFDYPGTKLTWTFWSYVWTPEKTGDYVLICRATDDTGALQTTKVRGTAPDGATGLHKVKAKVI